LSFPFRSEISSSIFSHGLLTERDSNESIPPGDIGVHSSKHVQRSRETETSFQFFVDEASFLKAAGKVTIEEFESFPREQCTSGGLAQATELDFLEFSVNARPYILFPNVDDTVFLCVGTADGGPRPTQGVNALIAGSNTGSTYVLEFLLGSPTRAVAFDYTDVAETGNFLFAQPDTDGGSTTISPCCEGPHEGFFGYVAKEAFTRFYLISDGRSDGLALDRIRRGMNFGRK
jgi:hypothetical protein